MHNDEQILRDARALCYLSRLAMRRLRAEEALLARTLRITIGFLLGFLVPTALLILAKTLL